MGTYRKKPVEIEAVQLLWENWDAVCALWGPGEGFPDGTSGCYVNPDTGAVSDKPETDEFVLGMQIGTLEGVMTAVEGDWIIKGLKGEFYPCKPDIFEASYEAVAQGLDDLQDAEPDTIGKN